MLVKIYALVDPSSTEIRYIGKTKSTLSRRLNEHKKNARRYSHHTANWISKLLREDSLPKIMLLEECGETEWQWYERWWIAYGKTQHWYLTNSTAGGDGIHNPSKETRHKISAWQTGRTLTESHRANISKGGKGLLRSEETRKRMSAASKSRPTISEETRKKIGLASRGRNSTLTDNKVSEIKKLLKAGSRCVDIARQFDVHPRTISSIKLGIRWKHVD